MTESSPALERYTTIGIEMAAREPSVSRSQMFGMPCLKVKGKAFAGLSGDSMVFKLSGEAHAIGLAIPGAALFDPMGGRPMKEWVGVPATSSEIWAELAEQALSYVSSVNAR